MRTLRADEIECRVGHSTDKGASLLLYKDARVDMRILDEVYGPMNWQRYHEVVNGNLYCTIQIWDSERGIWVSKQDVGKESLTEGEKGEASDAFKRAGFNWGIGRELYTAPFIWVTLTAEDFDNKNRIKTKFFCRDIEYKNQEISYLVIVDGKGNPRYTFGKKDNSLLEKAVKEILSCKSREEMILVWDKYPSLHEEWEFKNICTEQGKKFKNV